MKINVLITCGATWTAIDDVRVISNISTGEMGHLIAKAFKRAGARVTVIEGPVTHSLSDRGIKIIKYRFFDELAGLLKAELVKKYDVVIHAAAVSDFRVGKVNKNKITSAKPLTLRLVRTPKLIEQIKLLSPESFLVGFKLGSRLDPKNIFKTVKTLFSKSGCDLVVANTLKNGYQGYIVNADGEVLSKTDCKQTLAKELLKYVSLRAKRSNDTR
ncbi:MAG: phosphopantothenoylcysteine decarboxylase [Candidatus Omnitrophica bacterium]|nr:phosphopantothenoylcysteine decarboxylase [Candidatus Omnitrophota bacterium]